MNLRIKIESILLLFLIVVHTLCYVTQIIDWVHGKINCYNHQQNHSNKEKRRPTIAEQKSVKEQLDSRIFDWMFAEDEDEDSLPFI